MVRRFVSLDGEVLAEEEWEMNYNTQCFYCGNYLMAILNQPCPDGFIGMHEYVTVVDPVAW